MEMAQRPGLLILYGSETGTAEDVAELIGREAKRHLFHTRVMAMDTYARVRCRANECKNHHRFSFCILTCLCALIFSCQ
jgi:sulfite reductase alpha subunit-like flavoprotein